MVQGLDGLLAYQDGDNKEEHDSRLKLGLNCLAQRNVCINATGCKFRVKKMGLSVLKSTQYVTIQIQSPWSHWCEWSHQGCSHGYSWFMINFATSPHPLFPAQSSDEWRWTDEIVCRSLIRDVGDRSTLGVSAPDKPTMPVADAPGVGIGAVLEREGCPFICTSSPLNAAESGYSQTQKEAFVLFWAIVHEHQALQFLFNPTGSVAKSGNVIIQRCFDAVQLRLSTSTLQGDPSSRFHGCPGPTCVSSSNVTTPQSNRPLGRDGNQRWSENTLSFLRTSERVQWATWQSTTTWCFEEEFHYRWDPANACHEQRVPVLFNWIEMLSRSLDVNHCIQPRKRRDVFRKSFWM